MRAFPTIAAYLAFLRQAPAEMHLAQRAGEQVAGAALVEHAKDAIGLEKEAWPALAESTVEQKQRMGWTGRMSDTDPLFARGELRASIGFTADQSGIVLGSRDPIAPFHEYGTSRMPPRPFIAPTVLEHGREATETIAEHVVAAFVGGRPPRAK